MATVHTEYGPGRIIDRETVRGRTRYKVAGDGFEVWVDQTRLGGLAPGDDDYGVDYDEPGTGGAYGGEPPYYPGEDDPAALYRLRSRADEDGYGGYSDDDPAHYSSRRQAGWDNDDDDFAGDPRGRVFDVHDLRRRLDADDEMADDDPGRYSSRLAWAPFDRDNSTELPYNPDPQHRAIGTPGDDGASTIQPIHNIDADERLTPSDSISFDEGEEDGTPGPNPDLFAREGALNKQSVHWWMIKQIYDKAKDNFPEEIEKAHRYVEDALGLPPGSGKKIQHLTESAAAGAAVGTVAQGVDNQASQVANWASPGGPQGGYGNMIQSSIHNAGIEREAWFQVLLPLLEGLGAAGAAEGAGAAAAGAGAAAAGEGAAAAGGGALSGAAGSALRSLAPTAITHLMGGGGDEEAGEGSDFGPGAGYGDMIQAQASYRPAGLSDKYIDLTAAFDPTSPVSMFQHDPDAYINRVGHLAEEGLNPRFAEYMDLVEGDSGIRTAAWKDVRKKAMRLKREGHVTVKDIAPNRIMASVVGDHGTYDVVILKAGSFGGLTEGMPGHSIANWHCGCEWGKWAFRRKYTYVGRLCSHAYASYLTMQSAHMKGKPRQQKLPKRTKPTRNMMFPTRNTRHADNLQNGPKRLVPEMIVNDADDAHMFMDVTKDERDDTGPDDVVSEKDIVHFARVMRHCEVTESPYPRELVAFLSRYSSEADDTKADWKAQDGSGAGEYINRLRDLANSDQSDDFGNMADRVHAIQHTVEEAREHGVDASQFVAMLRTADDKKKNQAETRQDGGRTLYRNPGDANTGYSMENGVLSPIDYTGRGQQGGQGYNYNFNNTDMNGGQYKQMPGADGRTFYRNVGGGGVKDTGFEVGPDGNVKGVRYTGDGEQYVNGQSGGDRFEYDGQGDVAGKDFQEFLRNNPGLKAAPPAGQSPKAPTPAAPTPGNVPAAPGKTPGSANDPQAGGVTKSDGSIGNGNATSGQTSGPVSDGGRAGAENGDNSAITKKSPNIDADGNYTVQQGDTLTDIAQRTTGDMNKYQDIAKANPSIKNVDSLGVGTKVNLKDFVNDVGNNGVAGNFTNPAGSTKAVDKGTSSYNSGKATVQPAQQSADSSKQSSRRRAQAPSGGKTQTDSSAPLAAEAGGTSSPGAAPATNPATGQPSSAGGSTTNSTAPAPGTTEQVQPTRKDDTLDKNDPAQMAEQNQARPGQQPATMPAVGTGMGNDFSGGMDLLNTGIGAAGDIASGIGGALPGLASGIGSALSGIGSIFASKEDFDDWARYAYPTADGEGKLEPHDHPFAGSGWPGSLDIGTSEEYADEQRPKMDDVTDLEQHDVESSMSKWQKQGSYDESTDDNSDIVRAFQAGLADTALGAGAGGGSGRFDDISGAAQGFLRTAGRNYSLAEQSELIREGDKGGARNLGSLDLTGTHYEDMTTLGW